MTLASKRQGKARYGRVRQGKARQDNAGHELCSALRNTIHLDISASTVD